MTLQLVVMDNNKAKTIIYYSIQNLIGVSILPIVVQNWTISVQQDYTSHKRNHCRFLFRYIVVKQIYHDLRSWHIIKKLLILCCLESHLMNLPCLFINQILFYIKIEPPAFSILHWCLMIVNWNL
jgi:hypothetical protein